MKSTRRALLVFIVGLFCHAVAQEDDQYRLPPNYLLFHYHISLNISQESFTDESNGYTGNVQILFQVITTTTEVKLHSSYSNINLTSVQLDEKTLAEGSYSVDNVTDILTLQLTEELIGGTIYSLNIDFEANLLTSDGLYKTFYQNENNVTEYLVATQFEATSARKAFPCFDEPVYKATFSYELTYPSELTALANTNDVNETINNITNTKTTFYGDSPRMSVYLVAFTISKYTCSENNLEAGSITHRVCSRQDKESARDWAMELTPEIISHLSSFTGINYNQSLLKLDQVAVANKSGAMENWGLVLYGENALLFDKTLQTNSNKQSIAAIISHELAHQWFGNLVTCKWWSELFLNEGFATMFEFYTTGYVLPDFEMEKQFVIKVVQPMLTQDGSPGIRALKSNASTPGEISATFGSYSYYKGGSVLRMVEHIVGRDNFKTGIQKYLADNMFQSAEPEDLWTAIDSVLTDRTGLPEGTTLLEVAENWVTKSGYPVLDVVLNGTTITLSQKRFLISEDQTDDTAWYVPVSYTTSLENDFNENTSPKAWVTPTQNYVININSTSLAWIVINNQQTGYYRVNYDSTLWDNLASALKETNFSGIHESNRAQIIDDSFNLAKAGLISFHRLLKNIEFLVFDLSYFSWYPALNVFSYLLSKTGTSTKLGEAIRFHLIDYTASVTRSVPLSEVNDEDQIYTLNQVLINTYVCKFGNAGCINNAKQLFAEYKSSYTKPNINIRPIVYCNGIRHSDNPIEDWDFLWSQYQNESVSEEKTTIWSALGCATNTTVLNSFLSKVLLNDTANTVSLSQYSSLFASVYNANEIGVDTALDYLINNFGDIYQRFTDSNLNISGVFTGLGAAFTKISQIEKLEKFVNETEDATVVAYATAALSTAKSNQEIVEKHRNDLYLYYELSDDEDTNSTTISTTSSTSTSSTTTPSTTPEGGNRAASLGSISLISLVLIVVLNVVFSRT